jgi:hypothetical protein
MAAPGTHYRQGDILAIAVAAVPEEMELIKANPGARLPLVADDGGRPGGHLVTATSDVRGYRRAGGFGPIEWLEVGDEGLSLIHGQHGAMVLEPGLWRIVRQREYDPRTFPHLRVD